MVKKLRREGDASAGRPPKAAAPGSTKSEKFKKRRRLVKADPEKLKAEALESAASADASASAPAPKTVGTSTQAAAAAPHGAATESNHEDRKEKMKRREETGEGGDSKLSRPSRKEMAKGVEEQRRNQKEKSSRTKEKKEKDGDKSGYGFIFMCNAKTKPECYHHGVFGLPRGKMDVVEKIRPGAKLFLYDFDLKLMYGVYKATTRGGMDLVRHAFDGKFPAQVKFSVDLDCLPVPESSFRHAIKENYDSKSRFTQELSSKQVHRLLALFKPVSLSQSQPQQIEDMRHRHTIEDRRESYFYGERRASHQINARDGEPIKSHASLVEDHHTMLPQAPVALTSHHVPLTRGLPQVPPMYYHQVAPNSSYHQPHLDVMHDRTAAEVAFRDPLVSRDYRALPGDLAARSERLDELYRPLVSRDYGALPGDLAARSERLDELYRSYRHTTSTMGIHQQPSYENPRGIFVENLQRPLSTRVSRTSVPVSSRYSFAGPPTY